MEKKKVIKIQIMSAIIWAAVIIVCSYVLKDIRSSEQVVNILIVGATTHLLSLSSVFIRRRTVAKK